LLSVEPPPSDDESSPSAVDGSTEDAERGSPKYERAALRWLERYVSESSPRLPAFAKITASLARREPARLTTQRVSVRES
jgi:hypothetical protein